MLTARQIDAAKPKEKQYRLSDKDGLYLQVMPSGSKYWRWNTTIAGKQKTISYGVYPDVSLAQAREFHAARRDQGVEIQRDTMIFKAVADKWYRINAPRWKPKHAGQVWTTLEDYVLPEIGEIRIDKLTRRTLTAMMEKIDARGISETAHRVAQRVRAVLDYAVDAGLVESHPGAGLTRVLQSKPPVQHHAAVKIEELPELMRKIKSYEGDSVTRIGLQLLAHTIVRTGELISMQWDEITDDVWIVPAERMKRDRPHVVPLSKQVLSLLETLKPVTGESEYVLATYRNAHKPISNNAMLYALYRMGYRSRMTGHGFRSIASSVLNEQGFHRDAIERQLAHSETDEVRAAYHRAEYLTERKKNDAVVERLFRIIVSMLHGRALRYAAGPMQRPLYISIRWHVDRV